MKNQFSVECSLFYNFIGGYSWYTTDGDPIICNLPIVNEFNLYKCKINQKALFTWVENPKGNLIYKKYGDDVFRLGSDGNLRVLYTALEILVTEHFFKSNKKTIRADLYMELID